MYLHAPEFKALAEGTIDEENPVYDDLHRNGFIIDPMEIYSGELSHRLRAMKNYVFTATALHIFVVTTECNLRCVYCQAQDKKQRVKGRMTAETARKAVDVALQSPAKKLTFEFQGGEPLLNFPVIKEIIEYTERVKADKIIEYSLVSNFSLLTPEILEYLRARAVNICTSVDGPELLHDQNRKTVAGEGSYHFMMRGKKLLEEKGARFSAIQTTTRASLPYAREIVREYLKLGAPGVFLRPLTPLGFAKNDWEIIGYSADEWLEFYKEAFDEILKINRQGVRFVEQHALYFLRKILAGTAVNYMELRSPCGAGLGQLAYYYNGEVYTCDEARMVSETGDKSFLLGNVYEDDYQTIINSNTCKATCAASVVESLPGCCDCVYQPYCAVCPVVSYALNGDIFPRGQESYRCRIYGGILDFLFRIIQENDEETVQILRSWIEG